jgi:hypothetical protein
MKKFLISFLLCLSMNLVAFADDIQIPDAEAKQQLMTQWLKSHPDKAKELKEALSESQNPEATLEQWLDANPDCAEQLQNLIMPEGN